jgi:hypothetical protein
MNKCSKHLFSQISFGDRVRFWKYCHYDTDLNRFSFHAVTVINVCGFFPYRKCSRVYFNFCVWYKCKVDIYFGNDDAPISFHSTNCLFWFKKNPYSLIYSHRPQVLVSIKKYMPPPLPYFKVNIYPFLLPHFASIFFAYLWSFHWPNYIVTLPRYFSFRLPHLNITTGPPQTNRTRIVSERGLVKISVIETDAATSGPV